MKPGIGPTVGEGGGIGEGIAKHRTFPRSLYQCHLKVGDQVTDHT